MDDNLRKERENLNNLKKSRPDTGKTSKEDRDRWLNRIRLADGRIMRPEK